MELSHFEALSHLALVGLPKKVILVEDAPSATCSCRFMVLRFAATAAFFLRVPFGITMADLKETWGRCFFIR